MDTVTGTESSVRRDARLISDALKIRYTPMVAAAGSGCWVIDETGRKYLDFGACWALAGLGYSNAEVRAAITGQLERTMFAGLVSSINQPALDLAEKLIDLSPGDFPKKVWYGLAGSDASEAAQRLLRMATGKPRFVSFVGGWHGTTDATMALSAHPSLTGNLGGGHVTKIPYPNPYRNPFGGGDTSRVTDQCLDLLEGYLFKTICPPDQVAAIFAETVQSDGGDVVPPPDFLPKLRALCDRHGILLVIDDIKVGLGRTGKMFSTEHAGVAADLVVLGKSLGGGLPLSAIVGRADVLDVATGAALFTAVGNATSCAAGLATVSILEREAIPARAAEHGAYLKSALEQALGGIEEVGDIRGLGMILGVELVTDRASKEPNQALAARVVYRAWELGLILYYAGNWSNVLEITPPLILSKPEIDQGVSILATAVADALAGRVDEEAVAAFAGW